ncbi:DgyrCDS569 [Dimorphilus gyrociliatus]|uniref:Beta-galactosidase n=1 Tax=Dimorphilus gyrociliatus TaxID=2664684 RepID=A0A7I8V9H7_9ANNE|nr:DgyrCDS569 [Dimorphilus gyrociliatus]
MFSNTLLTFAFLLTVLPVAFFEETCKRTFKVDYDKRTFLKDSKPFRYVSGSLHYTRVPPELWKDRLTKMKYAGLDAIQTYVPWNLHEPSPGLYHFEGNADLELFLQTAADVGLLVLLRPGPYICAEWDFGGFPSWLIQQNASTVLRTSDPRFMKPAVRWLSFLYEKLKKYTYCNGGPIIMVQIENEYGSYGVCDKVYMKNLVKIAKSVLGESIVLYTTDGNVAQDLKCGTYPGVFATVDFGTGQNVSQAFQPLDQMQKGPRVNSEFYVGWLDYWGSPHAKVSTAAIIKSLKNLLDYGASVNMYMFEGGTSFAYWNGADPPFKVCPTSYDYDAPLSEAGDMTSKFEAIRKLLGKYKQLSPMNPVPKNSTKLNIGPVKMTKIASITDTKHIVLAKSVYPISQEDLSQSMGFTLYRTNLSERFYQAILNVSGIRDRGYISVNGLYQGTVDRNENTFLNISGGKDQVLDILVENQGRINFGSQITQNRKGLISNVTLNNRILKNWEISRVDPLLVNAVNKSQCAKGPTVFEGVFKSPRELGDMFAYFPNWTKGQLFVNGYNLGRYWPKKGPQISLYIPSAILLSPGYHNTIRILELEEVDCIQKGHNIYLKNVPDIDGPTSL